MISVIIPTLFPPSQLPEYAKALSRYRHVGEVIVVANTSGRDIDQDALHWRFLGKNRGYTGACNAGVRIAQGELLLFLNDDCELTEEALEAMVVYLKENADVVATQPIVMKRTANGEWRKDSNEAGGGEQIENIGFWIDTKVGKAYPVTETLNSKLETRREKNRGIYGLSGTCLLIRKDIFEKVGLWDETFHSYLEDVDMAIRLVKAGYKVAPCIDAEVTHEHMATSSRMGLYKQVRDVVNWWRIIRKHPDILPMSIPLLFERSRNMSGLIKQMLRVSTGLSSHRI